MRILFLGNETADTDLRVTELAKKDSTVNHGLVSNPVQDISLEGYYHTSVVDLTPGDIINLADKFDKVIMLDQPKENYKHYKAVITTVRLMFDLEDLGINVVYRDNQVAKNIIHWKEYLQTNKSFCFHAFLAVINDVGSTVLCPKKLTPLAKLEDIVDWQTDPNYLNIRNKMAAGELIPDRCQDCYDREEEGQESTRQFETIEWAEKLSLHSVDDFFAVKNPTFYEIRPSNKCNIMCRTCDDGHSHLIEREWKKHGTIPLLDWKFVNTPVNNINFESAERIYFGGGEPTIMPEFYDFLRKAIELGHTDFELEIGTNGMKFSNTLLDLLDHFSDVNLAFSFDGYKRVNDYIRWETDFDTIVRNSHMLQERGHKISLQSVFSMYSITRMHEVFEFYDSEYPISGALVQVAGGQNDIFMPYNHPCPDLVVESMRRCQQTKIYYMNGRSVKSMVDLTLDYYSNPEYKVDVDLLR
jgi:organic radical activating enzyme